MRYGVYNQLAMLLFSGSYMDCKSKSNYNQQEWGITFVLPIN